ncbi:MAG: YbaK/EbsC family protein [Pseudomonadota bacterium]
MTMLKPAAQRVQAAATTLDLKIAIIEMNESTKTAEDAARACGCSVAQIVKSLVFQRVDTSAPVMLLVSGTNRVDPARVADQTGFKLKRPGADVVRQQTGFAIGGIPPFGHAQPIATYIDTALLQHDVVWAAAGTPNAVFSVNPSNLASVTQAQIIDMS